ncbi:hypothetical protein N4T77_05130 [Clostridium sp. CX1]|uniref:hypothetical protein n=1 Tax=Clostridium sp. CX1 TaxID=2978346 RepID=UPI0021C19C8E|nr:hypothetical protein [Clostridium sp. CX1]MCT8975974.1 hypothetical protein [Clostridium sp. CX1]
MKVKICKWYNNAHSPVLFFIDDLANVWVDVNGNGKVDLGEDWGYDKDGENSSFRFLNETILKNFPMIKTTFFVPVGVRVGMIKNPKIMSVSKMINCDEKTKQFFKKINDEEKCEIAYHGTTHGKVGETASEFRQEWELFDSIDKAVRTINKGKDIYKEVFGGYPRGGKYCGYATNTLSDESIDSTGFLWWCRKWNRGVYGSNNKLDPQKLFDISTFGRNNIIDIPSTIDGGLLTGVFKANIKTIKGLIKRLLRGYLISKKMEQIQFLIDNKLVISIQEHMAPSRDDGMRQSPNIFDDKESLIYIFQYLQRQNVWYCTGTELAEYYWTRENINVETIDKTHFKLSNYIKENIKFNQLSIIIDNCKKVVCPDGSNIFASNNGCFNIEILNGIYTVY